MKKTKICFIVGSNPKFLGGISLFQNNFINYLKSIRFKGDLTWVFWGKENRIYTERGVKYVEFKVPCISLISEIFFNIKVSSFLKKNYFDIINSHAIWGYWLKNYEKKKNQKIVHIYHGSTYHYFKNHLKKFNWLKRFFMSPLLAYGLIMEGPSFKKADRLICVSNHVKKEIESLYKNKRTIKVIRTGVDLRLFKLKNKEKSRKKLGLRGRKLYGLYVGRGGFWTKGLDRVVKLSKEIYKLNKNYRLLIIGSDLKKVKYLISEPFIIFLKNIPREKMPDYYNSSNIFFCLSRYEGGAPTLVVSEAMASGCLVICSKDSRQEIINDEIEGIILKEKDNLEAKRILNFLNNKNKLNKIIKNSQKKIKDLSLKKWGKKILKGLLNKDENNQKL